jgi:hypothetical protein
MLGIDKFIIKEGSIFYLDLEEWGKTCDMLIEGGDTIKFSYENKKYIAKVIPPLNINFGILELSILKEL